jgi:Fe-S oxidoreductases
MLSLLKQRLHLAKQRKHFLKLCLALLFDCFEYFLFDNLILFADLCKKFEDMLFDEIIFGPVLSRRLGMSLGVNLMPSSKKVCNFNCVYCECGWNENTTAVKDKIHATQDIEQALTRRLKDLSEQGIELNSITFSGNGEPTLHPDFAKIVDIVLRERDTYCKGAKVSVLTNATRLINEDVFNALKRVDNPILKLDSAIEDTFYLISGADRQSVSFVSTKQKLIDFGHCATIQTLLLRGEHCGKRIDNTSKEEFASYLEVIKQIAPRSVMLYSIDRATPEKNLEKLSIAELETYAKQIRELGIETNTY